MLSGAAVSVLFDELLELEPGLSEVLSSVVTRHLAAASSHRVESFRGAAFLVVDDGFVVIRSSSAGRRRLVTSYAGAGALVTPPEPGEILLALVEARVTLVAEDVYADLLARPGVACLLSDALRSTLRQKHDSLANFGSSRPVERVERKLLQLAGDYGRVVADGVRLDFPVTHELLAEMIGSARETVSRSMDLLERSGFVVREGRTYRLRVNPGLIPT
jgi:CRP-like cAMP-binding protein